MKVSANTGLCFGLHATRRFPLKGGRGKRRRRVGPVGNLLQAFYLLCNGRFIIRSYKWEIDTRYFSPPRNLLFAPEGGKVRLPARSANLPIAPQPAVCPMRAEPGKTKFKIGCGGIAPFVNKISHRRQQRIRYKAGQWPLSGSSSKAGPRR